MTDKQHPLDGIPAGTRVRVTYEGTIFDGCRVQTDSGKRFIYDVDTVEVIAPPDPEWWPPQHLDIVLVGNTPWQRLGDGKWFTLGTTGLRMDKDFLREAFLIARGGKPYPPRGEA